MQPLGQVAAFLPLESARRVQALGHRPQLAEFPRLHLVVTVLRRTRRITAGHLRIASCQRFDTLFRVPERIRQRAGVEARRIPVRPVHEHAGERFGHEQMPCAAIAAQHVHG